MRKCVRAAKGAIPRPKVCRVASKLLYQLTSAGAAGGNLQDEF